VLSEEIGDGCNFTLLVIEIFKRDRVNIFVDGWNLVNSDLVHDFVILGELGECIPVDLKIRIAWMTEFQMFKPNSDCGTANFVILLELTVEARVCCRVSRLKENNFQVLREKWEFVVDFANVTKEVADVARVLELLTADLMNFDEAVNLSNKHFLNLRELGKIERDNSRIHEVLSRHKKRFVVLLRLVAGGSTLLAYLILHTGVEPTLLAPRAVLYDVLGQTRLEIEHVFPVLFRERRRIWVVVGDIGINVRIGSVQNSGGSWRIGAKHRRR
jgi:hypothetical protein